MAVWESLPVWGFIPVFLVPPHIRLVAPPYQGPQEVIAAIIGWGHWVKRPGPFRGTRSKGGEILGALGQGPYGTQGH